MARRQTLSPSTIDNLVRGQLRDRQTPGLLIEALPSGKKVWRYSRRVAGNGPLVRLSLGPFPACTIADARAWAGELNEHSEAGNDPRLLRQAEERRAAMTVTRAHQLYMEAVREGRSSRARRQNKPRTIADKVRIFDQEICPSLGKKVIHDVTEEELVRLVRNKGKTAKIRANRLAAELKVFFGWCCSLRGLEVGLSSDPSHRLHDLRFPETPRSRTLSAEEIEWFLIALCDEERDYRRGFLLWLLSAARLTEVIQARSCEVESDVWIIPAERTKNGVQHRIALGPWGGSAAAIGRAVALSSTQVGRTSVAEHVARGEP